VFSVGTLAVLVFLVNICLSCFGPFVFMFGIDPPGDPDQNYKELAVVSRFLIGV
jgi:hypothetical protein